jgi:hypothetical protein
MKIVLASAEEVAGFAVALNGMGYGKQLEEIGEYDSEWVVNLRKDHQVPSEVIEGITRAVKSENFQKMVEEKS